MIRVTGINQGIGDFASNSSNQKEFDEKKKKKKAMKLFVWTEFCPDYTDGLAFAVAHTEAEAKKLIEKYIGFSVYDWGKLTVHRLDRRVARCVSGGS